MKILHVTSSFKPSWETGGVVKVAYDMSLALKNAGHEVTVYTTDRGAKRLNVPKNTITHVDGIRVCYFRNISNFLANKKIVTPYLLPFMAKKEIIKFDVIHIHEHRSLLAVIVCHYARKYGVPYIIQAHGSLPSKIGKSILKQWSDHIFGNQVLWGASSGLPLNNTEAEQYNLMGVKPEKIQIIPNGIDLTEHENLPTANVFRKKYGIQQNQKIILYVGRLDSTKGIDLLIRSFAEILTKERYTRLFIIGGGEQKGDLEQIVTSLNLENNISFTGFVTKEDKMAAYVDADVFVTPSFTGFPMTFLEACLCGTPIVTTDKGDFLDWIDGEVGFVVKYNQEELAEAILRILCDDELRRRFAERGQELVQSRYNWGAIVKEIEAIYQKTQ